MENFFVFVLEAQNWQLTGIFTHKVLVLFFDASTYYRYILPLHP